MEIMNLSIIFGYLLRCFRNKEVALYRSGTNYSCGYLFSLEKYSDLTNGNLGNKSLYEILEKEYGLFLRPFEIGRQFRPGNMKLSVGY